MPKHAQTNDSNNDKKKRSVSPEESLNHEGVATSQSEDADKSESGEFFQDKASTEGVDDHGGVGPQHIAEAVVVDEKKSKKKKKHLTVQQKKSRRMRKVLVGVLILILILMGTLGYFAYLLYQEAQNQAYQQTITKDTTDVDELKSGDTKDSITEDKKEIEAPDLVSVLGKTQDEALKIIGRGATVISSTPVNEETNPVKSSVKVSLTDEPSATRSGTPTVYLDLDAEGKVLSAGYSAAATALGYGSSSFSDAIEKKKIIENTFDEAGLVLPSGAVVLPADKKLYSTYASDGTTLTKEQLSFTGTVEQNGATYDWSAVLLYDYTAANSTGNLANTERKIYIYVGIPGVSVGAPIEGTPDAAAEETPATHTEEAPTTPTEEAPAA